MGNKNSFQSHLDVVDLNTNYIADAKQNDSRFGEIKLLRRRETGEKIYQKDFTSNSTKEFEEYVNKIRKRVVLIHPNLLKVLGYNSKKEDLFCADFYKLSVFFESFETDLEKEIYQRAETNNYYTETELRCLLDSVIASCAYLEKNQISHSDIRPYNIFITKGREYKVCDGGLFQALYNPSYFGLLAGLEAKSHYPSPQVFKHYKDRETRSSDFNPYKNDVFGLGMSILAAAQLKHVDNAYDFKTKKVRQEVIDDSLRHLKGRYTEGFVEALRVLLSQEEAKRPTFVELDDEIKAYRSDIRAKANLERTLEAQRRHGDNEVLVRSPNRNPQSNPSHYVADDEADGRVRRAVERTEGNINSKSPNKFQNPAIDQHVQNYIRREPIQGGDKPLLYNVAPHLRMNDRFTPTLKVYPQSQNTNQAPTQLHESRYQNTAAHTTYGRERLDAPYQYQSSIPQSGNTAHAGQTFVTGSPYTNTNTNYGGYGESAAYNRQPNSGNYLAQNYL